MNKFFQKIAATLFAAITISVAAETSTSLAEIQTVAEDYVASFTDFPTGAKVVVKAKPLDQRLNLTKCSLPLTASAPPSRRTGRIVSVKVSCPDEPGWSVYSQVQTHIYQQVVVTAEKLDSDTLLGYDNLKIKEIDANHLRGGYFSEITPLIGARLVRRSAENSPVKRNNICQVCKGDSVIIYARSDSFELKTGGEAIGYGNVGDTIRVKNSRSQRIIDARIVAVGEVEVQL